MSQRSGNHQPAMRLSRRKALRLLGGAGATALLAACGGTTATPTAAPAPATTASSTAAATSAAATTSSTAASTTAATTTSSAAATATSSPASVATPAGTPVTSATPRAVAPPQGWRPLLTSGPITIYDTGAKLPTEAVSYRWIDAGLATRSFFTAFFPIYQQVHTNIKVQYDNLTDDVLQKTITASLQNGNAPDVFRIPGQYTLAQLVESGQVAALDDIIPNFAAWKQSFPPNGFLTGANVFNGKTYSFPQNSDHAFGALLYYNTAYLPPSEYDLAHQPLTWDTFRATAKKVTQQGAGKYYGYLIAGGVTGRWGLFVDILAQLAGAAGGAINWKTGEYQYTSDQHLGAIELLLAMKSDGSLFPGSVSLSQQDAVSRMGTGVAGMFLSEASNIPVWVSEHPDFKFDVASPPQPNSGPITPITTIPGGSFWVAYAKSKYQQISGDIFAYLGTAVGQVAYARTSGGGTRLFFPEASTIPELDPRARHAYQLFDQLTRVGPSPAVRNPDVQLVYREQRPLQPDFGTTIQGLYTGQLKDAKAAMKDLQDRSEAELQRAIKAAQAKGAKVSRDDWKFPNWDPTRDYTQADYDALK